MAIIQPAASSSASLCVIRSASAASRRPSSVELVRGKPGDQLPRSGRELVAVAAALGYAADGDPGIFLDDYRRATRRARAVVERVFYGW